MKFEGANEMEIKEFTITDLAEAISLNNLWSTKVIPITKYRAMSQVNNPRANGDDVVLLVAYENQDIIGYLGILPDTLFIDNAEHKIGWLSCWWVEHSRRSSGIGGFLLLRALKHYNQDIAVSSFSDSAKEVYDASRKFITLNKLEGMNITIRFMNSNILQRNVPKLKKIWLCLQFIDKIANVFVNLRLYIWKHNNNICKKIKYEYIREIDQETKQFIAKHRKNELARRDSLELDWIIKYPWVLSSPLRDKTSHRYHFSSVSDRFSYLSIKVFDSNDEMIGFVILKIRDNHLSIPYSYFDGKHAEQILYVIGYHMIEMDIDMFTTYNEDLIRNLSDTKFPYLYKSKTSRSSLISKKFKSEDLDNYCLQDGDGDCVFT